MHVLVELWTRAREQNDAAEDGKAEDVEKQRPETARVKHRRVLGLLRVGSDQIRDCVDASIQGLRKEEKWGQEDQQGCRWYEDNQTEKR